MEKIIRGYVFRLYPTIEQIILIEKSFGCYKYINSDNLLKYIKFDNKDVLFMYSRLIINDSYSLKG